MPRNFHVGLDESDRNSNRVRQTPLKCFEAQRGKTTRVHSGPTAAQPPPPSPPSSMPEKREGGTHTSNQSTNVCHVVAFDFSSHTRAGAGSDAECKRVSNCVQLHEGTYTLWITIYKCIYGCECKV